MSTGRMPENPSVSEMINWIASKYNMSKADLSRMFQTTQSTINYWMKTGRTSYKNLMKLRASYYYLHDSKDPHGNERKCVECKLWFPLSKYRDGKAICRGCENKKTLAYYLNHREEQLNKRRTKTRKPS